ncbi:MAG: transposase [Chitinophagales bacterium]|nr:transposase [Chitinophagales bacterium]
MPFGHKGNASVKVEQVMNAILYRLKTGCQWRMLPMAMFFDTDYSWKSVYYHFQKWSKGGYWEAVLQQLLRTHKTLIDTSCIQLDGSHTIAKRGGRLLIRDVRSIKPPICFSLQMPTEYHWLAADLLQATTMMLSR